VIESKSFMHCVGTYHYLLVIGHWTRGNQLGQLSSADDDDDNELRLDHGLLTRNDS